MTARVVDFSDENCPMIHEGIEMLYGVEPCTINELPTQCTCGAQLTYAEIVVFLSKEEFEEIIENNARECAEQDVEYLRAQLATERVQHQNCKASLASAEKQVGRLIASVEQLQSALDEARGCLSDMIHLADQLSGPTRARTLQTLQYMQRTERARALAVPKEPGADTPEGE